MIKSHHSCSSCHQAPSALTGLESQQGTLSHLCPRWYHTPTSAAAGNAQPLPRALLQSQHNPRRSRPGLQILHPPRRAAHLLAHWREHLHKPWSPWKAENTRNSSRNPALNQTSQLPGKTFLPLSSPEPALGSPALGEAERRVWPLWQQPRCHLR